VYLKPFGAHHSIAGRSLITSTGQWTAHLESIYDHIETLAKTHLSQTASTATLDFHIYLIHGDSTKTKPPAITRPDYSSHERREGDADDGADDGADESAENEPEEGDVDLRREASPVFTLTFTQTGGKVRTTQSAIDADVLGCHWNGECSRCRVEED
jgi:hypothetical protein